MNSNVNNNKALGLSLTGNKKNLFVFWKNSFGINLWNIKMQFFLNIEL